MRRSLVIIFVVLISAVLAIASAAAETRLPKSDRPPPASKVLPLKGTAGANPCAAYGPGFVKVDGIGTCMKIGGALDVGAAVSVRR
jgi:hypothetical protein